MPHLPYQAYRSKRLSRLADDIIPSPPKIILAPPSPVPNGLPSPPASNHSQESHDSPLDISETRLSASTSPIASTSTLASPENPSSPLKASKFRRVIPQPKPRAPLPPSPLALASRELHSRSSSVASLPPPPPQVSRTPPVPSASNQSEPQLPARTQSPFASPTLSERALPPLPPLIPDVSTGKFVAKPVPSSAVPPPSISQVSSISSTKPDSVHGHRSGASRTLASNRTSAPYRPGFQPKGVYRHLTDDFLASRKLKRDGGGNSRKMNRVEREKLQRRLEKLVDLHFPLHPPSPTSKPSVNTSGTPMRRPVSASMAHNLKRTSSIFDLDAYKNINLRDAGDLWKTVLKGNLKDGNKPDKRAIEQRITPWEEDSTVSKCPLCLASFHPLTNRKHHCRLCGRIICSLPVKSSQRPVTCSILFVLDSKTRKIEEVGEGVDYGVRKRRNSSIGKIDEIDSDEKFLKGVRICRECRPILQREEYQQERLHTPTFVKLHEAFIALEREIEDALPQFQELVLALNHNDQPTKEAHATRKRLLEAFAQYDALAKRIKHLPCPNGSGSSQDRVQAAILMRANLFLQKNMFPLQSLSMPSLNKGSGSSMSTPGHNSLPNPVEGPGIDPDSELAQTLQPLLEQEALLESFVEEAVAQRKFEDVKTLKVNLEEIRREIERLLDGVDVNSNKGKGKSRR